MWDSKNRELCFIDNGTGMTINEVENFLLKVGKSRYRTKEFIKKYPEFPAISRFGIGILTCFLISDDIDIITNSKEEKQANEISIRKVNGKYLLKKVEKETVEDVIQKHGTMIKLHVRQIVDMSEILENIRKWVIIPSSKVILIIDNNEAIEIGYKTPKEVIRDYLNKNDYLKGKTKVNVKQESVNGVTVAYAVVYNEFLGEWNFLKVNNRHRKNDSNYFVGTCIEGIRVEFNTPGYNECGILALANIEGNSSVKTNVARSAIESNKNEKLLTSIYEIFKNHVQNQLEELYKNNRRSLPWVASESKYLISSLLSSEYNNISAQNEKVLNRILNDIRCIIIENELNERKIVSPNELSKIDEFYIIDSDMVKAAERLFREIRTNESLCNLINTLNSDHNNKLVGMKNIIFNFDNNNLLHINALKMKEVNLIKIHRDYRRIDLKFGDKLGLWYEFTLHSRRRYGDISKVYMPLKGDMIEGIQDEIGVNTSTGLFLKYGHQFTKYLNDQISKFDYRNNRKDLNAVRLFLTLIFNTRILELTASSSDNKNKLFKNVIERENEVSVSGETEIILWNKVNKDELSTFMFKEKYNIYDNSKWTRNAFDMRYF
ncbi:ATP-binding protein [Clostridium botulinum]|nr:ATP-binding protein [Clostridium botulinum]MCS4482996.1 ATP-binding protein [Clostridium botulinum]